MVRCSLLVVLSLIAVSCAFPSPKGPKISIVKNSDFGLGFAAAGSHSSGVLSGNSYGQGNAPLPSQEGEDDAWPEIALVDNVNLSGAAAIGNSSAFGVVKHSMFASVNPFG